jgi:hypothetical protein
MLSKESLLCLKITEQKKLRLVLKLEHILENLLRLVKFIQIRRSLLNQQD